jgi:hyperosmotically inducible protein
MMHHIQKTTQVALVIPFFFVLFVGCQALTGKTLGRHIDDGTITTTVKTKLASDDATSLARISVRTHEGIVNLTGTVKTSEIKQRAGKIAGGVGEVRGVVNNLQVQNR